MFLGLVKENRSRFFIPALAAAPDEGVKASNLTTPTVTAVDPSQAPNDVDTPIVIQGTGFTATLSGTAVITAPTVALGEGALPGVVWVNTTTMSATVPWGLTPNVYSLTVINPDGVSTTLKNAFTVTQGIGVFTNEGPFGGQVQEIYKKPGKPTTIFARVDEVGLFRSENSGGEWELVYAFGWMTSLTFDAVNPDIMYIGTWDSSTYARSLDGGDTWENVPQITFPGKANPGRTYVAAHPAKADTIFVAVGSLEGFADTGQYGVFRSDNNSMTWITLTNGMTDTDVQSLAIHPIVTQTMLAGTENGILYQSIDGGENWTVSAHMTGSIRHIQFNPYKLPMDAWVTSSTFDQTFLARSDDLSKWEIIWNDPYHGGGTTWDLSFLPGTIWATYQLTGVYTSTHDGNDWHPIGNYHRTPYAIEVTPDNPQEVYLGTDFGVYKSGDGGTSWQVINEGLAGLVPYAIATSSLDPELVFVKTSQGFYRSFNGGQAWQLMKFGGGPDPADHALAIDPYTSTRIYYGGCRFDDQFCMQISSDTGEIWEMVTTTLPVTYIGMGHQGGNVIFPHPLIPGRILVGNTIQDSHTAEKNYGLIFASDDYGQNWEYLGPTDPISSILSIAYDAVAPNLIYMGTIGGGYWKSTDGGLTWERMSGIGDGGIYSVVATHPTLSGHAIAHVTGESGGNFITQDAGETWSQLPGPGAAGWPLIGTPLVYAPTFPVSLYAFCILGDGAQLYGLCRSYNDGYTWEIIPGAPGPTRLATASDGERVVLYNGSPGGLAYQTDTRAMTTNAIQTDFTIFGGGVYRLTTLLPTDWVYLPLVMRGHTP